MGDERLRIIQWRRAAIRLGPDKFVSRWDLRSGDHFKTQPTHGMVYLSVVITEWLGTEYMVSVQAICEVVRRKVRSILDPRSGDVRR